jgi:hypothetical protein
MPLRARHGRPRRVGHDGVMRVRFAGSGDAFGSGGRWQTCIHLAAEGQVLLVDCGATSLVALKAVRTATLDPGPVGLTIALTTGPGRNWASLWKPLIDAFGPVLGEGPTRPFHPHDDRIVSLDMHHTIDTGIAHDVIIDAWWTRL